MRIAFSEHALDKLKDRKLSKEQVKEIVRKPDEVRFEEIREINRP